MKNREIEVKFRVAGKAKFDRLTARLGDHLSAEVKQRDRVFAEPGRVGSESDAIWLRIRSEDDMRHIFNLKQAVTDDLDSTEHETEVSDPDEMTEIIKLQGYVPYSDLTKYRRKGTIGSIEICLDRVDGLGYFVEAEKMVDDSADAKAVRKELVNVLESFDVDTSDEITIGYDQLEREARGIKSSV